MAELNWDLDQGTVALGRPVSLPKGQEPPAQDLGPNYFLLSGFQRLFGQLVEGQGGVQFSKGLLFAPALPLAPGSCGVSGSLSPPGMKACPLAQVPLTKQRHRWLRGAAGEHPAFPSLHPRSIKNSLGCAR